MFGIHDYWAFVGAIFVFLALPGPGTFCVLASVGRHGVRGGYASVAGLIVGDQVLLWLAVAGVAAILKSHPLAFHAMQYLGAGYLCYLGLRLVFPGKGNVTSAVPFTNAEDFRRGLMVTLINPKAIIFYMAFFPLFIDPALHRGMITFGAMAVTIAVCTLLYCSLLVLAGHGLARRLAAHRRIASLSSKLAGLFLIGFGIRLTTN